MTAGVAFRILKWVSVPAIRLRVLSVLQEQQSLTAVERFSQRHAANDVPNARIYEDLIPLSSPGPGQQYGFRVDLDACTGCKACVAACHSLNGLDDEEAWRTVGLLHGGSSAAPVQQTVTTACHHCLDPACMSGCPVKAYEKDPVTGIVRHLDDQCIGCQYCTLTCPYEVPKYNKSRGIVRKCDMCSDRLAASEAPACVQSCPNQAIAIQIVDKARALEDAQVGSTLPGAPSPGVTAPTTEYVTTRAFPKNMIPADFHQVQSGHPHMPLVFLLVLTQLSVGAFVIEWMLRRVAPAFGWSLGLEPARATHALVALGAGLLALGASIFHLGRPKYAFRAVLGLRTSWMSREVVAFGAFAKSAAIYAAFMWREPILRAAAPAVAVRRVVRRRHRTRAGRDRRGERAGRRLLLGDDLRQDRPRVVERRAHRVSLLRERRRAGPVHDDPVPGRARRPQRDHATRGRRAGAAAGVRDGREARLGGRRSSPTWPTSSSAPSGGPRSCSRAISGTSSGRGWRSGSRGARWCRSCWRGSASRGRSAPAPSRSPRSVSSALVVAELLERALFFRASSPPRMPGSLA